MLVATSGRAGVYAAMTGLDVARIRSRFPALARQGDDGRPVVYADAPGGSQLPDAVIEAIGAHLRRGISNTHGAFPASKETDQLIADARRAAGDLTGADPGQIVFAIPRRTSRTLNGNRMHSRAATASAAFRTWCFPARARRSCR